MSEEIIKLMATIESETGLEAFKIYMELKWYQFWADCLLHSAFGAIFLSVIIIIARAIYNDLKAEISE